jgi:hypothetical protein
LLGVLGAELLDHPRQIGHAVKRRGVRTVSVGNVQQLQSEGRLGYRNIVKTMRSKYQRKAHETAKKLLVKIQHHGCFEKFYIMFRVAWLAL